MAGVGGDVADRLFEALSTMADADLLVAGQAFVKLSRRPGIDSQQRDAAAGTIPSSAAARVACRASSMRALVCFISASVGAPTRINATPPESLASRSWNFSLSYSLSVSSIWRRS